MTFFKKNLQGFTLLDDNLTLWVPWDFSMLVYRGGVLFHTPFQNNVLSQKKNHIFSSVDKFWPNSSFILRFAANSLHNFDNFGVFYSKMSKNYNFYKTWPTNMLYTWRESWNYSKFDFVAKKYNLYKKNKQKRWYFDFWPKNEAD